MAEIKTQSEIKAQPDCARAGHPDYVRLPTVMLFAAAVAAPALMLILATSGVVHPRTAEALGTDYGGRIIAFVPAIPDPTDPFLPLCPAHMTTVNFNKSGPKILGLYARPGASFRYLHSFLFNGANLFFFPASLPIGASVLGKNIPAPWRSCPLPYSVVPFYSVRGINLIGTSLK